MRHALPRSSARLILSSSVVICHAKVRMLPLEQADYTDKDPEVVMEQSSLTQTLLVKSVNLFYRGILFPPHAVSM